MTENLGPLNAWHAGPPISALREALRPRGRKLADIWRGYEALAGQGRGSVKPDELCRCVRDLAVASSMGAGGGVAGRQSIA